MRAAQARGHAIWAAEQTSLHWMKSSVAATATRLSLADNDEDWYRAHETEVRPLKGFAAVIMRKDPPFDLEYVASTWLLSAAAREGARVFNAPDAIRDHNEKLGILEFPRFTAPTLVAREPERIQAFIDEHRDVVVKKLDGMGGTMIFRIAAADPNRNVIVEAMTDMGARTVMAQRYIPEIALGDKRILVLGGKPFSHCLARIPKAGETRGNLAAGGRGVAQPISTRDREIGETVGRELVKAGIVFAGLDVIGDWLTEVNVTSPTCIVEIAQQTGHNAAIDLMDAVGA